MKSEKGKSEKGKGRDTIYRFVLDGFCIAKKTVRIREIRACPVGGTP